MDRRSFLKMTLVAGAAAITTPAIAGGHGRVAAFKKKNSYAVSGRAEIAKKGNGYVINLLDDFEFAGAPDPKIALGKNGYDSDTLMGLLKSNKGASSYEVPAGINPDDYNEVWIWCEKFNVPLAVASF